MINPQQSDIGRKVLYTGNRYPGGKIEEGVINSFNLVTVFVRYGADTHSKGTNREDLEWATECKLEVGQIWKENDPRAERLVRIIQIAAGRRGVLIQTVIKPEDGIRDNPHRYIPKPRSRS